MTYRVAFQRGGLVDTGMGAGGERIEVWDAMVIRKITASNRQARGGRGGTDSPTDRVASETSYWRGSHGYALATPPVLTRWADYC